jgi:LCP family protein required for cell wall assembly
MSARRKVGVAVSLICLALISSQVPRVVTTVSHHVVAAGLARNDVRAQDLDRPDDGRVHYLIIGSDARQALSGRRLGHLTGQRADSIALLSVGRDSRRTDLLSIPRDLRVDVLDHGAQKLAGSFAYGAAALVHAIRGATGLKIHHCVIVDFDALTSTVDAVGGLVMRFPFAVRDRYSRLRLAAGMHKINGSQALAYLRSRNLRQFRGEHWRPVGSGDIGRIHRQQRFLAAALAQVGHSADLRMLRQWSDAVGDHVHVDAAFGAGDIARLRAALRATRRPVMVTLPTRPMVAGAHAMSPFPPAHLGNVGYRILAQPEAGPVLRRFGASAVRGNDR